MDVIVFGATGFVGRRLVAHLLATGQQVAAVVGTDATTDGVAGDTAVGTDAGTGTNSFAHWPNTPNADSARLEVVRADLTRPLSDLPEARDVYHLPGARPGSGERSREARATDTPRAFHVLEWAASLPGLRRLVHLDGETTAAGSRTNQSGAGTGGATYGEAALVTRAREVGVPLTLVTSDTLEQNEDARLTSLVQALWNGRPSVVSQRARTSVPGAAADALAQFLAEAPAGPAGEHHWVSEADDMPLSALVAAVAAHAGVRAPRLRVPSVVLRRLPGASPGVAAGMMSSRPTGLSLRASAGAPSTATGPTASSADTVGAWVDDLIGTRFGTAPVLMQPYGFCSVAGNRTWVAGGRNRPAHVLLHGMPMNADIWAPLVARLDGPVLAADLPGLGRSAPTAVPLTAWLDDLLSTTNTRPTMVAHSATCGPVVRFAAAHPDRIGGLVLVAPAFLQPPGARLARSAPAVPIMRRMSAARLAETLGVPAGAATKSAAADLGRPGVARSVVRTLRSDVAGREWSQELLGEVKVPVRIIVGAEDSPIVDPGHPVARINGAGHYPQLTHPDEVARHLSGDAA